MATPQARLDRQVLLDLTYVHFIVDRQPAGSSLPDQNGKPVRFAYLHGDMADLPRSDLDFLHAVQEAHDHAMERANASNWTFEAYFQQALHNGLNDLAQRYQLQLPSIAVAI